jgi:nucleotide-binding universal stress UspA family protein
MAMFTHLLVLVDGSEHAKRAVQAAADLAQRYGAKLTLMHVLSQSGSLAVPEELKAYSELEHIRITERDLIQTAGNEILKNAETLARKNGATKCQIVLKTGDPATCITNHVKKNGVDLVVMGRRGLGDLAGLFLGSVSHKVAQATDCTCLTVK